MPEKPQFSLRWMFVAIAVVAVIVAEAGAFPPSFAQVFGLSVTALLPGAFVTGIVYARGRGQAFSIGALVCWFAALCMLAWRNNYFVRYGGQLDFSILWSLAVAGGLLAVFVRWLTLSTSFDESPRSGDRV